MKLETLIKIKWRIEKLQNKKYIKVIIFFVLLSLLIPNISMAMELVGEEEREILKDNFKLEDGKFTSVGKDKNLIVLQVESLQNFIIGFKYNGLEITPNLNKLANHSIYYNKYYELVGEGDRADAEFVSNNSFHPSKDRVAYEDYQNY